MSCATGIPVLPTPFTAGDTQSPIRVQWGVTITTETSELVIDRPVPSSTLTIAGNLLDASVGLFEFPWSTGDLVAGEGQRCKARLLFSGGGRQSSETFLINVQDDLT